MMKVFLCETIHPEAYRLLSEHAEIISTRDRMGEADALISRVIAVGAAEMDVMPELKVIAVPVPYPGAGGSPRQRMRGFRGRGVPERGCGVPGAAAE